MSKMVGTISRGVRAPIIREGDNLSEIVVDCVLEAAKSEPFEIRDKDVIAVTEAVVARAQGNYASVEQIAKDVHEKFGDDTVGVLFPILSRNRFSICLKGIAKGCRKIVLMLSYPSDEVGNHLVDLDVMDEKALIHGQTYCQKKNTENCSDTKNTYLPVLTMWTIIKM